MKKTFITEQDQFHMKLTLDKSADMNTKLRNILRSAIDEIVNLFEYFDVTSIDIGNYDDQFEVTLYDDYGQPRNTLISRADLEDGSIYLIDTEGYTHTSDEWFHDATIVFTELSECLNEKLKGIQQLAVGKKVRWIDPGIEDYDEEDRQDILDRVFTINSCPEVIERDSVIGISCDGSEAEVLPMELVLMPD